MTRSELERLINVIVQEMAAAGTRAEERCQCHAVSEECCPDRLRGVIDAGASGWACMPPAGAPEGVAAMIDHTLLKPDATRQEIEALCREAAQFGFATVCVNPVWVSVAASQLAATPVRVCSVVGIPAGGHDG